MSMKRLLLVLISLLLYTGIYAESVSRSDALKKAQSFMPGKHFVESQSVASARAQSSGKPDAFYVFNADDNGGFVIVSGDDRTTEILGYSKTGNFDIEQIPENLKWWLDGYCRQIEALGTTLKPAVKSSTRSSAAIAPLIKTKWNQNDPYNYMCPDGYGNDYKDATYNPNNRCLTGCVATAMAQVMYYWKWPESCPGIDGYTSYYGASLKALPATTFNWDQMKTTYGKNETGAAAEAVAKLMRYCGQAVIMDYGVEYSSAYLSTSALAGVFNYSKNLCELFRDGYTTSKWESLVYDELAKGRPVLYGGLTKNDEGHQFIVDGYDGNGLFHMNWGWGGLSDDYFVLSIADPDNQGAGGSASNGAYQYEQSAIFGVQPPVAGEVMLPVLFSNIEEFSTINATRSGVSEDFTNVYLNAEIHSSYSIEAESPLNAQIGWALYQNDEFVSCIGSKDVSIPVYGGEYYGIIDNNMTVSFGAGLATGKYQLCQVYKLPGDTSWRLTEGTSNTNYIIANVGTTTLNIRMADQNSSYTTKSIVVSDNPEVGSPVKVTATITNNGESQKLMVNLWAQKLGSDTWTNVAQSALELAPGKTADVSLSFVPKEQGTYTLKVSQTSADEAVTTTINVVGSFEFFDGKGIKYLCNPIQKHAKVIYDDSYHFMENVVIPATITVEGVQYSVTSIDDEAFLECDNLTSVVISNGITSIGESAFEGAYNADFTLPTTLKTIGDYAFWDAESIVDLILPEGLESIGVGAFDCCFNLQNLTLPSTLKSIGEDAFLRTIRLSTVISHIKEPFEIDVSVFAKEFEWDEINKWYLFTKSSATLIVPVGTKTKYNATAGWDMFQSITEMMTPVLGDINGDGEVDKKDLDTIVQFIMAGEYDEKADLNHDGKVDAADIVEMVNIMKK